MFLKRANYKPNIDDINYEYVFEGSRFGILGEVIIYLNLLFKRSERNQRGKTHSELIKLLFSIKNPRDNYSWNYPAQLRWLYLVIIYVSGGKFKSRWREDNDPLNGDEIEKAVAVTLHHLLWHSWEKLFILLIFKFFSIKHFKQITKTLRKICYL